MANFTLQNMTPGNAADCYLPGCNGVVGGLCVGALPTGANVNQTLWWCCTPYAETCRGGQSACPGTNCSNGSASWCCNEELESCPGANGLEGSCVPKNYTNPVLDGPAWGPGASSSASGSSEPSTFTSTTASSTLTLPATSTTATESSVPTGSGTAAAGRDGSGSGGGSGGISAGAAAGVGVVGGGLFVLAAVGAVWWFRRRRGGPEQRRRSGMYLGEMEGSRKPIEMEARALHEMEGAVSVTSEMEGATATSMKSVDEGAGKARR
ncbi:hypothetical protein DFP73DRAFT_332531 [Morchella snyderi]|nr:hypothetical protein DFP73DRAFT_332531 [Morchella snyderi]